MPRYHKTEKTASSTREAEDSSSEASSCTSNELFEVQNLLPEVFTSTRKEVLEQLYRKRDMLWMELCRKKDIAFENIDFEDLCSKLQSSDQPKTDCLKDLVETEFVPIRAVESAIDEIVKEALLESFNMNDEKIRSLESTMTELKLKHATLTSEVFIGILEQRFFPSWLFISDEFSRYSKWNLVLQLELTAELAALNERIKSNGLRREDVADAIVTYYGEIPSTRPVRTSDMPSLTDIEWNLFFLRNRFMDEKGCLALKCVLKTDTKEFEFKGEKKEKSYVQRINDVLKLAEGEFVEKKNGNLRSVSEDCLFDIRFHNDKIQTDEHVLDLFENSDGVSKIALVMDRNSYENRAMVLVKNIPGTEARKIRDTLMKHELVNEVHCYSTE